MNNPSTITSSLLGRLLSRTGRYYILSVLGLALLVTTPLGLLLAAVSIQTNARFSQNQLVSILSVAVGIMLVRNVILVVVASLTSREASARLESLLHPGRPALPGESVSRSWRQIIQFAWKYVLLSYSSLLLLALLPVVLYMRFSGAFSSEQILYTITGTLGIGLLLALLEVLLVERMLLPARLLLLPDRFEDQIAGMGGFRFLGKLIAAIFILMLISILLVAPIGVHQTTIALTGLYEPQVVLRSLFQDLLLAALAAVVFGLGLAYLLTRSISDPLNQIINAFRTIEAGDLSRRVPIASTDEIGELGIYLNRMIGRVAEFQTNLENTISTRTDQLQATIEVGRAASANLDPQELIHQVVNLISDRFGYYYSAIFLVDENARWAELIDASGVAGQILKAQGHKLEIGRRSMVSNTILSKQASIALDVGEQPVRFDNPLLPQTRSEIALPLIVGDAVIGVLDVQSVQEAAFSQDNIETLQAMANQVAIAVENARLFQQTQNSLDELRTAQKAYLSHSWASTARENREYEVSVGEAEDDEEPSDMTEIPLTLREQKIGHLSLEGEENWTAEERTMIEAIATQATLALENARLLEESQQLALRERLVAEITGKIWSGADTDVILQTAIRELGRALSADEGTIALDVEH